MTLNEGKLKDYYKIGKKLGEGAFGEVRTCKHLESGQLRAVKVLKKSIMNINHDFMFQNEITNLKELDHPNILKMYEYFEDEKRYYIITDICNGGDLFEELDTIGNFNEFDAS